MNVNTLLAAIAEHANIHVQVATRTGSHFVQVTPEAARGLVTAAGNGELGMLRQHGILYIGAAAAAPEPRLVEGQHVAFGDLPLGATFRFLPNGTYDYTKTDYDMAKREGRVPMEVAKGRAVAVVA